MSLKRLSEKFIEYPTGPVEDINETFYKVQTKCFILGGKVVANEIVKIILDDDFDAETASVDECLILIKKIINKTQEFLKDG